MRLVHIHAARGACRPERSAELKDANSVNRSLFGHEDARAAERGEAFPAFTSKFSVASRVRVLPSS